MVFNFNFRQEEIKQHFKQAENRIRYCYQFINEDHELAAKAFQKALFYIPQCEWEEAHY